MVRQDDKIKMCILNASKHVEQDMRDDRWSESIAVGSKGFVEQVKDEWGFRAQHRRVLVADGLFTLREPVPAYSDLALVLLLSPFTIHFL
jgi:hypothetical protein